MGLDGEEQEVASRVGATIDKYTLLRVLGSGGMGAVYEAEHLITGKRVALKLMHPTMHGDGASTMRFLREARAASSIGHPSIVDVLDAGQLPGGGVYLALELLDGILLTRAVESRVLTIADILQVGVQVLEALEAAHGRGIIHRDIKPDNVFITRDGRGRIRVKLLDFGLAKDVRRDVGLNSTRAGMILGTPYYMSPEQARGEPVDHRSDLFSVGAMLYFAFTGAPPFEGASYAQLMVRVLTEDPRRLTEACPQLPISVERVIEKSLAKATDRRWQSATEMVDALRRAGTEVSEGYLGVPPSVLPPPSGEQAILGAIDAATRDLEMTVGATPLSHSQRAARSAEGPPAMGSGTTPAAWARTTTEATAAPSRGWIVWVAAALAVLVLGGAGLAGAGALGVFSTDPAQASPGGASPSALPARPAASPSLDLEERPSVALPSALAEPAAAAIPEPGADGTTSDDAGTRARATTRRAVEPAATPARTGETAQPPARAGEPTRPARRSRDRHAPVTEYE